MSCEDKIFKDIRLRNKPLNECELIFKSKTDDQRLYVVKDNRSFWCHAVEFHSCEMEPDDLESDDLWENDNLIVNTIFEVTAYFDGVRHLEFNRGGHDSDGYLYYPNMPALIEMLQKVRELELEICSKDDIS